MAEFPAEAGAKQGSAEAAPPPVGSAGASTALLEAALTAAANAILITDRHGTVEWLNPAFTRLTGYAAEETLGRSVSGLLKSDRQPVGVYRELWETIQAGQIWHGELWNRRKDGSLYLEEQSITPVKDGDGATRHYVAIKQDITRRRETEEALRESQKALEAYREHLEDVIRERTAELVTARAEAEQLARVKSEFLANMSHEIRTPLNAVIGLTSLCLDGGLPPRQRDYLEKSLKAARLLLAMLNDILDFSKIEAGELRLEHIPFSLDEVYANLDTLFAGKAGEKGLELRLTQADDIPARLSGDPLRLSQVLTNLVGNAIKFTEHGKVAVSVTAAQSAGDVAILNFEVNDTGIGMDEAQIGRLFRPFSQADSSTTRRFGGTGLGLVISDKLVAQMGGRLSVASSPGMGSRFRFRLCFDLPAGEPDASGPSDGASAPDPTAVLRGRRVLLVEDNELNRQVAGEILARAGMEVGMAEDGRQALASLADAAWDVVLMDIQMPVMDGLAATRALRARAGAPRPPVIAMTAHAGAEERARCRAAGMDDFITKPFLPAALLQVLARNLQAGAPLPAPPAPPAAPDGEASPPAHGLDREQGLAFSHGDPAHYRRLLAHFQGKEADILDRAARALAEGRPEHARRLAHSLKGMAGTLGAARLRGLAAQLERDLAAGSADPSGRLAAAEEELALVLDDITHHLAT